MQRKGIGEDGIPWTLVYNTENEDVPPFGLMEADTSSGEQSITDSGAIKVKKPTRAGFTSEVFFNGPNAIPKLSEGQAHQTLPTVVAFQSGDPQPAPGDLWGVKADSWLLNAGVANGFRIVGGATTDAARRSGIDSLVNIMRAEIQSPVFFQVTSLTPKVVDGVTYYKGKWEAWNASTNTLTTLAPVDPDYALITFTNWGNFGYPSSFAQPALNAHYPATFIGDKGGHQVFRAIDLPIAGQAHGGVVPSWAIDFFNAGEDYPDRNGAFETGRPILINFPPDPSPEGYPEDFLPPDGWALWGPLFCGRPIQLGFGDAGYVYEIASTQTGSRLQDESIAGTQTVAGTPGPGAEIVPGYANSQQILLTMMDAAAGHDPWVVAWGQLAVCFNNVAAQTEIVARGGMWSGAPSIDPIVGPWTTNFAVTKRNGAGTETKYAGIWDTLVDGTIVSGGLITTKGTGLVNTITIGSTVVSGGSGILGSVGGVVVVINAIDSITLSGTDLLLVNDSATPGNSKYYGTNSGGTKGWFALPSASYTFQYSLSETAGVVNLTGDTASPGNNKYYGTNGSGTRGWYATSGGTSYTFTDSLNESGGTVNLDGDDNAPGNNKYYGTDSGGSKGFHDFTLTIGATVSGSAGILVNSGGTLGAIGGSDGATLIYQGGAWGAVVTGGYLGTVTTSSYTTLGNIVAKVELRDPMGSLIGYLPVYDSIT